MKYDYLIEKIQKASFFTEPFEHLLIEDFFNEEHFSLFQKDKQIHPESAISNEHLRQILRNNKYAPINFPGCTISEEAYFNSLKERKVKITNNGHYDKELNKILEGFGITYKLNEIRSKEINEIVTFLSSKRFKEVLDKKFNLSNTRVHIGIQKNLTNYEISPHPDIRQKALTFLLNINSEISDDIGFENFNTKMLKFKKEKEHVYSFWNNNPKIQRCWVPWEWCEVIKTIKNNNSLLMFRPSNKTLHAVRLKYDHLKTQRTQIYGNLMFNNSGNYRNSSYKELL